MAIISIDKNEGELLHELIERVRLLHNIPDSIPITYAGRLDPLASGIMILLTGDDVHKKDQYLGLPKEYIVDILFGISTDTGDPLGLITNISDKDINIENINKVLPDFVGTYEVRYPIYSSRKVDGIPLAIRARDGEVVTAPNHIVTIDEIVYLGSEQKLSNELRQEVIERIKKVSGNFRQEQIALSWNNTHLGNDIKYTLAKIIVRAHSGAYMRVLAEDIGKSIGIPALAWRIVRTSVGEYKS